MARKLFLCGHVGKGLYCHECERLRKESAAVRTYKEYPQGGERRARVSAAPISLVRLPSDVQDRALKLIETIKKGTPCHKIPHAKRLAKSGRRDVISIKIGWKHRLVCREQTSGEVRPEWVGSHETYNKRYSKTVR